MKVSDQTILLTGGAGAIGQGLSENLYQDAKVVVLDRDERALSRLSERLPELHCYLCDLTVPEEVEVAIARVYKEQPPVTVLLNNAGSIHSEPLVNLLSKGRKRHSLENWKRTIDNNLNSLFYVTSCVAEQMVSTRVKGLILNISSISAGGNAGQSAYSAAKAAVNALTITWAQELGMFGIRSAAIAPGFLDTSSTHQALKEANLQKWIKQTPLTRLGMLDELIMSVRFIIENDFFTGRVLELDGGLRI